MEVHKRSAGFQVLTWFVEVLRRTRLQSLLLFGILQIQSMISLRFSTY